MAEDTTTTSTPKSGSADTTPASQEPEPIKKPVPIEGTGDQRDTSKVDTLGNEKIHIDEVGPRGSNAPQDMLTDADRKRMAEEADRRAHQNMASTDKVDSVGNPQGHFETSPGGKDEHGAKKPDTVHYDRPIEEQPAHLGPRGKDAPKETFHRSK
jgi:hypothetical protein